QNLQFSAAVARDHGRTGPLVVVTNNYHVLRAALLSRKLGIDAQVVGSPTAGYFLPSAFLREFVAILQEHKRLHALMCLPFVALLQEHERLHALMCLRFVALTVVLTTAIILANQ